jgi:hypothetical protein
MSKKTNKYVFDFLREISPYLVGLNRKTRVQYTFLASPYLSSCFSVDVFEGKLCLGVPQDIFDKLYKLRIYSLSYIAGQSSFFFVFDMDTNTVLKTHPMAIRFFLRSSRVRLFESFQKIHIVRMNDDGVFVNRKGASIPLLLREIEELEWEDF